MATSIPVIVSTPVGIELREKFESLGDFSRSSDLTAWMEQSHPLADEAARNNEHTLAICIYERCIALAGDGWGPADSRTLELRRRQANELLKLEQFDVAELCFQQILSLAEPQLRINPSHRTSYLECIANLADMRINWATNLMNRSKFDEALAIINDTREMCAHHWGEAHRFTRQAKAASDACYHKKCRAELAWRQQEQRKSMREARETIRQLSQRQGAYKQQTQTTAQSAGTPFQSSNGAPSRAAPPPPPSSKRPLQRPHSESIRGSLATSQPVSTFSHNRGVTQLLASEDSPIHLSDIWLGQKLKESHRLVFNRGDACG